MANCKGVSSAHSSGRVPRKTLTSLISPHVAPSRSSIAPPALGCIDPGGAVSAWIALRVSPRLAAPKKVNFEILVMLEQLCTCSKTYTKYSQEINPYPENSDSLRSLELLTQSIITPVINKFGRENFKLTYGFCSKDLLKFLRREKSRICVEVDQHMAHEINNKGNYYCKHLGAACDFQIIGIDSRKIIAYLKSLNFDSIYYYGQSQPIHISWISNSPA